MAVHARASMHANVPHSMLIQDGVPKGIRTPVAAVKGQCPGPLDDGDVTKGAGILIASATRKPP